MGAASAYFLKVGALRTASRYCHRSDVFASIILLPKAEPGSYWVLGVFTSSATVRVRLIHTPRGVIDGKVRFSAEMTWFRRRYRILLASRSLPLQRWGTSGWARGSRCQRTNDPEDLGVVRRWSGKVVAMAICRVAHLLDKGDPFRVPSRDFPKEPAKKFLTIVH